MSIFSFLRKLSIFNGRSTEGLQEEDLDFPKWIAVHQDWRKRLLAYIEGSNKESLDEETICQDDHCELGLWIHGNGKKFYGGEPSFQRLLDDHAAFHRAAGEVVSQYKCHGEKHAWRALNGEFELHSMHVISALQELEHRVKQ